MHQQEMNESEVKWSKIEIEMQIATKDAKNQILGYNVSKTF